MMNKCKSIRLHHDCIAESNQDRDHLTAQMDDTLAVEIYYRERECDTGTSGAYTHPIWNERYTRTLTAVPHTHNLYRRVFTDLPNGQNQVLLI